VTKYTCSDTGDCATTVTIGVYLAPNLAIEGGTGTGSRSSPRPRPSRRPWDRLIAGTDGGGSRGPRTRPRDPSKGEDMAEGTDLQAGPSRRPPGSGACNGFLSAA